MLVLVKSEVPLNAPFGNRSN